MQRCKSLVTAIALPLMAITTPAIAQESDLQQQIDRITSVEQVKEELAELIRSSDQCGVGSCFNSIVIVHCAGGLDRTGHILASWLVYQNDLSNQDAIRYCLLGRNPAHARAQLDNLLDCCRN
jgi:protein-tyrosine phosphatase